MGGRADTAVDADFKIGFAFGTNPDRLRLQEIERCFGSAAKTDAPRLVQGCFAFVFDQPFFELAIEGAIRSAPVVELKMFFGPFHTTHQVVIKNILVGEDAYQRGDMQTKVEQH